MKLPIKFNTKDAITVFVVAFILLAIPLTVVTVINQRDERGKAAGTASIRLVPATGNVNVNNNITLAVWENSGTDLVNALQVKLTYDATKFDFVSIDKTGSAFPTNDPTKDIGASGVVYTFGLTSTPVTGDKFFANVTLKAKVTPGSTPINFVTGTTDGTYVIRASDSVDILGTNTGATITIVDPLPTVSITSPTASAALRGTVAVTADATDNISVSRVDFYIDNSPTPAQSVTIPNTGTSTYQFNWNTTTVPNANHTITAKAVDGSGGVSNPASTVTVNVDNALPVPTITSPTNGQVINGTAFNITATATDNVAVTKVEFVVDATTPVADTTSPYILPLNTTTLTNAAHQLTVRAYDAAGNIGTQTISFTVDNQPPSKPVLTPSVISDTQINLSWTVSTDNLSSVTYDVYRNGTKINASPLTTTSFSDTGLVGSTSYTYYIQAKDTIGNPNNSLSVVATTQAPPKVGDLNKDGFVNIFDASILFNNWNSTTTPAYDLNHNGIIDIFDASILFNNWTG